MKVEFIATVSAIGAYAVYDENSNFLGYSDTYGKIEYDRNGSVTSEFDKLQIEIISIDESAWE